MNKILNSKLLVGIATVVIFSLNANSTFAAEYYKWVDSKGTTHYSKNPPPKSAKKRTTVKTYGYRGNTSTTTPPTTPTAPVSPETTEVVAPQVAPPAEQSKPAPEIVENPTPTEIPLPMVRKD